MLVDTSDPSNCGNSLYQSMVYHQEKAPTSLIKRLLLCSVFHSVPSNEGIDISEVETSVCVSLLRECMYVQYNLLCILYSVLFDTIVITCLYASLLVFIKINN